jgi:hypothetical protein
MFRFASGVQKGRRSTPHQSSPITAGVSPPRGQAADYRFPGDSERPSNGRAHARKGRPARAPAARAYTPASAQGMRASAFRARVLARILQDGALAAHAAWTCRAIRRPVRQEPEDRKGAIGVAARGPGRLMTRQRRNNVSSSPRRFERAADRSLAGVGTAAKADPASRRRARAWSQALPAFLCRILGGSAPDLVPNFASSTRSALAPRSHTRRRGRP